MHRQIEELDYSQTPIGTLSLRRRYEPLAGKDVFEVKLGDEFLMSSLFTASEIALAQLGVTAVDGNNLDIVVGGLGLGYTAGAVLDHQCVAFRNGVFAVKHHFFMTRRRDTIVRSRGSALGAGCASRRDGRFLLP